MKDRRYQSLTPAERLILMQGRREGGDICLSEPQRRGGAIIRMLERLRERGFVEGPPWRITQSGLDLLRERQS